MRKILFFISLISFLMGCNFNHIKNEGSQAAAGSDPRVGVSALSLDYASLQAAVFTPNCLQCHSAAGGNQGGLSLESYPQVRANLNKIYYRSVEIRDMPPSALPSGQLELLKTWIEAGAPLKNTGKNTGPIRGPITWDVIKKQVLGTSCLDCHSGVHPDGDLNFESLEDVRENITAIFESAVIKQTMPLEPYSAMSEVEKQTLMKWISQGMPN
jgi:uncharacterized membrane protein